MVDVKEVINIVEEGVDAGAVEKVVEEIIELKLEIFQGGHRKVTDQQTKVTVIFISFSKSSNVKHSRWQTRS